MKVVVNEVVRSKNLKALQDIEEATNYFGTPLGGRSTELRDKLGAWAIVDLWALAEVRENTDNVAMGGLWYDRYDGYALDIEVTATFDRKNWDKATAQLKAILDYITSGKIVEDYRSRRERR